MDFALSTHWNAGRHGSGESMLEEIIEAGFNHVELGYNLTLDLVPGVLRMVDDGSINIDSVHCYCPVPVGVAYPSPELFLLADRDENSRRMAVRHTIRTLEFAARVHARAVVAHAGRIRTRNLTARLVELSEAGKQETNRYDRIRTKMIMRRDRLAGRYLDKLCRSIDEMMPALENAGVRLAFENLPSWETVPAEHEIPALMERYGTGHLGYWHDMGHGRIRQNLGFCSQLRSLEMLKPYLVGMHLHDVLPPALDHLMPPNGEIDFKPFKSFCTSGIVLVFEPAPGTPVGAIIEAREHVRRAWSEDILQE